MGTQQSGVLDLKIADVVKDSKILVAAEILQFLYCKKTLIYLKRRKYTY